MTIQLKPFLESVPIMQKFLAFYLDSELSSSSDHNSLRQKAEIFVNQNKSDIEILLKHYREYTSEDFEFDSSFSEESQYDFIIGFENFLITVCRVIKKMPVQIDFGGFSRQDSPPLEVYDFIGHNKLDIKHNRINYSDLYK